MEDEEMLEGMGTRSVQAEQPLHMAAETQNKAMCELLYNNGALLNVKDSMGFTPLDSVLFNSIRNWMDESVLTKKMKPKMTQKGGKPSLPA